MRKFRIEVEGRIHEVNVEEIKLTAETETQIAVIAAAIASYMGAEGDVGEAKAASVWSSIGKFDLMAPLKGGRKVPRWAKAMSSGWSLSGRKWLMKRELEGWDEEV